MYVQPCCRASRAAVLWWGLPSSPASGPEVAAVDVCYVCCGQHRQGGFLSVGTGAWLGAVIVTACTLQFFFLTCACTALISKGWNKLKLDQVCLHSFCMHAYSMIQLDQMWHCFVRHQGTFLCSCLKIMASKHGWKDKEQARGRRHGFCS